MRPSGLPPSQVVSILGESATIRSMVRIRCTQRVLKRFKLEIGVEPEDDSSTTLLGDWYANLLNVERQRWVLCVSERTLLPALVTARNDCFPAQLSRAVGDVLRELGVPGAVVEHEVGEMESVVVGRTRSRSVLGVMNDFAFAIELALRDGCSALEAAVHVSNTPVKPLDYRSPQQVALELLGGGSLRGLQ